MAVISIDARGKACPQPIIELAKAVRSRAPGDEIELWATDDAIEPDLAAWSASTGHRVESLKRRDGAWVARVRVTGQPHFSRPR